MYFVLLLAVVFGTSYSGDPACGARGVGGVGTRPSLYNELVRVDTQLDKDYKEIQSRLLANNRKKLTAEQRLWIKRRDAICQLDNSDFRSRKQWHQHLRKDWRKMLCVVRLTVARSKVIGKYYNRVLTGRDPKIADPTKLRLDKKAASEFPSQTGRWYGERIVDIDTLKKRGDVAVFFGVRSFKTGYGKSLRITRDSKLPSTMVIGTAVDLVNNKIYIRINGQWEDGRPGSGGGTPMKPGKEIYSYTEASIPLEPLYMDRVIISNLGQAKFVYPPPTGFSSSYDEYIKKYRID